MACVAAVVTHAKQNAACKSLRCHRFKTAEAAWNQEKAQYRHEAEVQRKKANKLHFEYEKLQV